MNRTMMKHLIKQRISKRLRTQPGGDHVQLRGRHPAFGSEEDGGMTIIALFVFILMLTMGGISIDLMRHEMERTQLQSTLDSAVLAGAGAPAGATEADIKAIVQDFFAKSGKSDYLNEIGDGDIIATLNARKVKASADMTINTYIMKLMGVNTMIAGGGATAEVRTPKLEVALVLDVSGSMRGSKLANLKTAAKEFVTTMLDSADSGDTIISVVPFSWTTAPGEGIYTAMAENTFESQKYSTCLRFSTDQYNESFIAPKLDPLGDGPKYTQQIYTSRSGGFDNLNDEWRSCFTDDYAEILAYSISESDLHDKIDLLHASGNTSGHIGMKWGAALLDPAFRDVATSLQGQGLMNTTLTNVPSLYTEPDTMKIIVIMGDGANTDSYYFDWNSPYRAGPSDLFEVTYTDMEFKYAYHIYKHKTSYNENKCNRRNWKCVYEASDEVQSVNYLRDNSHYLGYGNWGIAYYAIESHRWITEAEFDDLENTMDGYIGTEQHDWPYAWGRMSPEYYRDVTGDSGPRNDYRYSETEYGSTKNTRMRSICSATKATGVTVYSIGFEVPENGTAETELRSCATSIANYYRASGVNISDAFGSIASNVQNLRLTQ